MDPSKPTSPPNILFIMSDDHAAHAMSCYTTKMEGRPVINQTPNIDRIANEGMLLNNCFCTNSICTPSRAVILTGQYSHKTGVTTLSTHLDNKISTFPQILQNNGYQTAMIGKWHLGTGNNHCPTGFDYWKVFPGQGMYKNPKMIEMGKTKKCKGYATDIVTDDSISWLEQRDQTKPFLLMCHHKAPHRPWVPDEKHQNMYEDEDIPTPRTFNDDYSNRAKAAAHANMRIDRTFYPVDLKLKAPFYKKFVSMGVPDDFSKYSIKTQQGKKLTFKNEEDLKFWKYQQYIKDYLRCIASIDDNIGRMLDYLDREGLTENTIVIYTSDQGFFLGDHGWFDKRFMYEESLRMPFVIRYPKEIPKGKINDAIILNVDFAQTFLDYAGLSIPPQMQGKSVRHLFQGNQDPSWRQSFYYRYWVNGTFHKVYAHYGIRTHQYKLIYYYCDPLDQKGASYDPGEPEWEFFDLINDPYEMNNCINDPKYRENIENLKKTLHNLQAEIGDIPHSSDL